MSFNTVEQLLTGYDGLLRFIKSRTSSLELARLNQYLHEKKRIHKLYSILREKAFFEMVVQENVDSTTKDIKDLTFEPVLNVKNDLELPYNGTAFYKCSVDSELAFFGVHCGSLDSERKFLCVDMESKEVVFQKAACGHHCHHWILNKKQKYLSLQTQKNEIQ